MYQRCPRSAHAAAQDLLRGGTKATQYNSRTRARRNEEQNRSGTSDYDPLLPVQYYESLDALRCYVRTKNCTRKKRSVSIAEYSSVARSARPRLPARSPKLRSRSRRTPRSAACSTALPSQTNLDDCLVAGSMAENNFHSSRLDPTITAAPEADPCATTKMPLLCPTCGDGTVAHSRTHLVGVPERLAPDDHDFAVRSSRAHGVANPG